MKTNFYFIIFLLILGCSKPQPRRPINPKASTTIFQDNIETAKKMAKYEDEKILDFIRKDSLKVYQNSSNGFWYTYKNKNLTDTISPKTDDVVEIEYDIRDLNDSIIYSKEELGVKTYRVDKEDFISGIQKGIKLMKIGETITFVIPSYNAFGITGDGNKIEMNKTIKSNVKLINIK